ncbi:MAG: ABC transporter ATP-binding protein [Clostridia bacterium]|nr:ABC transporter ATP-binding protein [Clostridia bacterium]
MIKRFTAYYKPHLRLFVIDLVCAFLVAVCDLIFPMLTRQIINVYIPGKMLRLLLIWCGVLLAIYVVKMLLNYVVNYLGHVVGVRMQSDMRRDIFSHLQKLPFTYFDNNKTGALMSRIVNDLQEVTELAHHGPEDLFLSLVLLFGAFGFMASIHWWLTLIVFSCLPFLVWFAAKKRLKMSRAFTETRARVSEINAGLENSLAGIRVSKAFTNQEHEIKNFQVNNQNFVSARSAAYGAMAEFSCGTGFILDFLNVIVLVAGGYFYFYGQISVGDFAAFLLFVNTFLSPVKRLISFIEQFQDGMSGFKRFVEILDQSPEQEAENALSPDCVKGDIVFDNVSFSYDNGKSVLQNISFQIPAGKTVALVGESGGGKTTICHLIPRFYELNEGVITVDGHDITTLSRQFLRKNIGMVTQDVFLFTGTVYENIVYGNLNASMEQVVAATKAAGIYDDIMALPDQFETYVGERGVKFSGGQKQRISIARVFLKDPPILILDEATSALDNATEAYVKDALDRLCKNRTTLVVAHRLSTVENADQILVVSDKGIEESGTHQQLLEHNGIYARLQRGIRA